MSHRFTRPGIDNPPLHYPGWAEGEQVVLRPRKTWGLVARSQRFAAEQVGEDRLADLSAEERNAAMQQYLSDDVETALAVQAHILAGMILSWTFRYPPTEEQQAAGLPGDAVAITAETVAEFDDDEFAFLMAEIATRSGALPVPEVPDLGEGGDFRHPVGTPGEGEPGLALAGPGEPDGEVGAHGGAGDREDGLDVRPT